MKSKPYKAKSITGAQAFVRSLLRQRERCEQLLVRYDRDRKLLAKLASKTPLFYNPLEAMAAETLRDDILSRMGVPSTPQTRSHDR
jgi:hypothetical protein